ncbi:hypothetical protein ADICYQ_1822 [Cyclobacterium qasimii M12-11B]|uniref:Uncharacterized protein n=1 Tax=Cyclobacterium qasimii M12-11B TaxID=641524 RepID=S7WR29_9BACT|nr:hypothetical protein ADICYQ_1822 [Cyclobacterium qasimii M12-11B]
MNWNFGGYFNLTPNVIAFSEFSHGGLKSLVRRSQQAIEGQLAIWG